MDLLQLKRFIAAAETGNLRRAAAKLHISQPALTQSIKSLEQTLGVDLFDRGVRGVALTRYGELLIPWAKMMLNERERIAQDLEHARSEDFMRLTVGVAPYFSRQLFPAAVLQLAQRRPTAQVQVVEAHTTELVKLLQEGAIEFAFCVHNPIIAADAALEFSETYTERYTVMARSGHPVFRKRRVSDRELAAYDWIAYDTRYTRGYLARHFESRGLPVPRTPISTLSLPLMVTLLIRSDFLALMPEDFVWPEVAASRLRRVVGHTIHVDGVARIVTRKAAVQRLIARELIECLQSVCADARVAARRAHADARGIATATLPSPAA